MRQGEEKDPPVAHVGLSPTGTHILCTISLGHPPKSTSEGHEEVLSVVGEMALVDVVVRVNGEVALITDQR